MSGGIPKRVLITKIQSNTPFFFGMPVGGGSVSTIGQGRAGRKQINSRISSMPAGTIRVDPGSKPFTTLTELYLAIDKRLSGNNNLKSEMFKIYGYIKNWDVSALTSLYDVSKGGLFENGRISTVTGTLLLSLIHISEPTRPY